MRVSASDIINGIKPYSVTLYVIPFPSIFPSFSVGRNFYYFSSIQGYKIEKILYDLRTRIIYYFKHGYNKLKKSIRGSSLFLIHADKLTVWVKAFSLDLLTRTKLLTHFTIKTPSAHLSFFYLADVNVLSSVCVKAIRSIQRVSGAFQKVFFRGRFW